MPKYLIGYRDSPFEAQEFKIVNAACADDAISIFISAFVPTDDSFLRYVYGKAVNASFSAHFWLRMQDEPTRCGENDADLVGDEEFRTRVRALFGRHHAYADRYLGYYFSEQDDEERTRTEHFPPEMLIYTWRQSEYASLLTIPLEDFGEV
jgi:hypothetical protein